MHESEKVKVKSLSHVWLLATPWTAAYQAPPSMGFSRQEYWSGVPSTSPTVLFTHWKFVATLCQAGVTILFNSICLLSVSVSHFVIQYFKYYCCCYGDLQSMIFVVTIVIDLGHYEPQPCKTWNLINVACVLTATSTSSSPSLSVSSSLAET